jgi:hypothetical protein
MNEKGMISMSEFKTVVEQFKDSQKKIVEVINHRFDKSDVRFAKIEKDLKKTNDVMTREFKIAHDERRSMREQIALLHEGQTGIRTDLREKASFKEVKELQKRVTRLENKLA